jgi:hypothetical protein
MVGLLCFTKQARAVLGQIEIGRDIVVLIALVALELAELNEPRLGHSLVIRSIARSYEIDPNVRAIGGCEIGQPEHPLAADVENRRRAPGLMGHRVEAPTQQPGRCGSGLCRGRGGRHPLVDPLVHEEELGPEEVPAYATEHDEGSNPKATIHRSLLRKVRVGSELPAITTGRWEMVPRPEKRER